MASAAKSTFYRLLPLTLKPIARLCLRHSLHIQDVIEAAKIAFISAAQEELTRTEERASDCKISTMTGIHRRDVVRIGRAQEIRPEPQGLVSRIIGQWQHDKRFTTHSNQPRILPFEGEESLFRILCRTVTNDVTPGTILHELERVGAVERVKTGLRLTVSSNLSTRDIEQGMKLLSRDSFHLFEAVESNLFGEDSVPNLHLQTQYDRVSPRALKKIRQWLLKEGSAFHKRARTFLSQFDSDLNPKIERPAQPAKVVLCSFSLTTTGANSGGTKDED